MASHTRRKLKLPDQIPLNPLLDLWEQQEPEGPDATRIYEFYRSLAEGKFVTTRCITCGKIHFPPLIVCPNCNGEDLEWIEIPEEGELYAFTELKLGAPVIVEDYAPFVIAVARFGNYPENGVQISGMMFDVSYEDLKVGDRVTWEIMEIVGPGDKTRYWYCFTRV
ncbi:Zn-ribbon domain-containing OB-fold protein [Geoglobus acetivorans]|uniref:Uncharacterized protein n=1 Tax=Geoglobus acetivorans TaxID=565033 RepID=A0A0A7GFY7_GEOAI|nr:hypothetical protein GACE_0767 [Geoglobus acetivorans]